MVPLPEDCLKVKLKALWVPNMLGIRMPILHRRNYGIRLQIFYRQLRSPWCKMLFKDLLAISKAVTDIGQTLLGTLVGMHLQCSMVVIPYRCVYTKLVNHLKNLNYWEFVVQLLAVLQPRGIVRMKLATVHSMNIYVMWKRTTPLWPTNVQRRADDVQPVDALIGMTGLSFICK